MCSKELFYFFILQFEDALIIKVCNTKDVVNEVIQQAEGKLAYILDHLWYNVKFKPS